MQVQVVGFIPPIVGVEGDFNTFRLGQAFAKRLNPGQVVFLMDEKTKVVFGRAQIVELHMGMLRQMCLLHGTKNHTEVGRPDREQSPERLFAFIQKIYGPHIATESKKCAVIYMRRIADELGVDEHDAVRQAPRQDDRGDLQGRGRPGVSCVDAPDEEGRARGGVLLQP